MRNRIFKRDEGSALLVTVGAIAVLAIAMSSYLTLVSNQNRSVARATAWNQAIPVAESGIEEALTQIHYCWVDNLSTNGWTFGADGLYHKTRGFKDGSYYSVNISPTNPPTIMATGFVVVPFFSTSPTSYVSRRIIVKTRPPSSGGISAKGTITMSGGGIVDSFDSTDPNYSSNGVYVASKRKDNAKVLTDSSVSAAIALGNGKVYGYATTGPTGTVTVGANGGLGDAAYLSTHTGTEEAGRTANNANVQFDSVPAPFTYGTGLAPNTGLLGLGFLYGLTNYTYQCGNGNYNLAGGFNLSGQQAMLITGNPSTLYCNGSFSVSGQAYIYIAPGASLQLYVNGNAAFSGGGVVNGTSAATNCYVYGMTNCTTMAYSGGSAFVGIVNAPNADFTYSGNADASGAVLASTVTISGGGNFHYDESIGAKGAVVLSWNEF